MFTTCTLRFWEGSKVCGVLMANAFLQCARICFPGAKTYRGGGFGGVGGGAVLREGRNGPKFGEEGEIRKIVLRRRTVKLNAGH